MKNEKNLYNNISRIFNVGKEVDMRVILWLVGLKMAQEQIR